MSAQDHKRPNRLRREPKPKRKVRGPKLAFRRMSLDDGHEYECGFCRTIYVSYDYPSERACPYCGHSEV